MRKSTKWILFVAVASIIAVLPLQAQGRGDKNDRGDKGKSGQGFHNERHDGNKGDKHHDRKDDRRKGDGKHHDGDRHDGDGHGGGCDKPPTPATFTVTATGDAFAAIVGPTSVASGQQGTWVVTPTLGDVTVTIFVDGIPVFSGLLTTPYLLTLTVTATMTISVVSDVIIIG